MPVSSPISSFFTYTSRSLVILSFVYPNISRALELTQHYHPSAVLRHIGISLETSSSNSLRGSTGLSHADTIHPEATSRLVSGCFSRKSLTISTHSSADLVPSRFRSLSCI